MQKLVPNGVSVGVQRLELPGIPRCKRGIDVDSQAKRSMTDFPNSLCYPPWIPAPAGMTSRDGACRGSNTALRLPSGFLSPSSSHRTSFEGTASRAPTVTRATDFALPCLPKRPGQVANLTPTSAMGRAEGLSPSAFLLSPKSGGHGVEYKMLRCLPDSCLRGNDTRYATEGE
jgi:hypothetical protein